MSRAIDSIVEAHEEEILNREETEAVLCFIVGKFVQRRLDKTMQDVVSGTTHQWRMSGTRYLKRG